MRPLQTLLIATLATIYNPFHSLGQLRSDDPTSILHAIEKLNTTATVLYVAAHPDDENTRLLTYLANEKKFRTVYISLTRGEGGQNLIGNEQGTPLGIIRTKELLAARLVDGAEQAFGDCADFGYSKSPEETFKFWDQEDALGQMVWAIRKYRPDVIINRFPTTGEGGHGHHTASALLAVDAFKAAADPNRFKEQLNLVQPWQAKRIFLNSFSSRNQTANSFEGQLKIDVGGYDVLHGRSHGETASESRSMHKSQGFGVLRQRGTLIEYFKKLDGDTAVKDVFENIPTTWDRIAGGSKIKSAIDKIAKDFDVRNPSKSLAALVKLLPLIRNCQDNYWKAIKEQELTEIIRACSGLWMEASAIRFKSVPGDTLSVQFSVIARSSPDVILKQIRTQGLDTVPQFKLVANEPFNIKRVVEIDPKSGYTSPYWLEQTNGTVNWSQSGLSWSEDLMQATFIFEILGENVVYKKPYVFKWVDPVKGECQRPFEIIPVVSIEPTASVAISNNGASTKVAFILLSEKDSIKGRLKLNTESGWRVQPEFIDVVTGPKEKPTTCTFELFPPPPSDRDVMMITGSTSTAAAVFETAGKTYQHTVKRIVYDHIPAVVYLEQAAIRVMTTSFQSKAKKIGYIAGAGDDVDACLRLAGFEVDVLNDKSITKGSLDGYDAIVTGIRAYNTNEEIGLWQDALMRYVDNGGTLVVQYNTSNFLGTVKTAVGPYPFKITRDRVTEEGAKPTFLLSNHTLLNKPNRITDADFLNWVQERGLYFAGETAPEYEKPIAWNDLGEKPMDGSIIYARKGKGHFIYTGVSFFRQLPAGIPGAYRLMVNMLNVGKE